MGTELERVEPLHSCGTVAYRVTVDDRWVGWVGDMRPWRGWRYGGRQWWACWREEGDTAARWNSNDDQPHRTRATALADLLEHIGPVVWCRTSSLKTDYMMADEGELSLGCLIRDLRLALGYSQGLLASRLCDLGGATVTRETVSRWERGKRSPGPYWLRHLATALEVPLRALEDANVRRRDFLTTAAATAIAPIAAADLISSGFAAAFNGRPSVDEWENTLTTYGRDYMALGAGQIQRRLAGDLVVLQQQLDDPALWGVAARLMTVYGKTIPGADGAKAIHWYRMAAAAADRSGHDPVRVWVRGRAAIALGYEGASLPVANAFADQALAIGGRPSLGQLNAIMGKAHAAAIHGDRVGAATLLERGRRVFDAAGSYEQTSDYAVPEWRMAVFCSLLHARLGNERAALDAQVAAERTLPDSLPRFRTHLEMHRGLMLVRAGDRTSGVEYARNALNQLPPEKHSLTLRMLLAEIEGRPAA